MWLEHPRVPPFWRDASCPSRDDAHALPARPRTCLACRATAHLPRLGCLAPTAGLAGHVARAFRRCSWSPTGHFSGGAHPQLFRKHGDPPFSRRIGQCWAPTQVWSDPADGIGQNVVRSSGPGRKRTMPSRKGWVTGLPEELCVCAAAEETRLRPAAAPERARYMASQAIHELPRPH